MAANTIKILNPETGLLEDRAPDAAEAEFRAGRVNLPDTEQYALSGADGRVAGYFLGNKVSEALQSGFRFATPDEERAHIAEGQPLQAFLEGTLNDVALPGMYDLPAQAMGADMDMIRARRASGAGQAGQAAGFVGGFFIPGVNLLTAEKAAARVAGHVLPHAIAEAGQQAATKAAEKLMAGYLAPGAARSAISHALGAAPIGGAVGMLGVLDEAALGNTEASTESLLTGGLAGTLIGSAVGGGLGAILGRSAARVDGRVAVGGAEAARAAEEAATGHLNAGELLTALEGSGAEVTEAGNRKWFPRLMAKLSGQATGADEGDILRVMTPAGQKIVLEGERARDRAVESLAGVLNDLETNTGRFNLDEARLQDSVLSAIPAENGDLIADSARDALDGAREAIREQIKAAVNYGMTREQVTAKMKPLMQAFAEAEDRIVKAATPADILSRDAAEAVPSFKPRGKSRAKTNTESHVVNTDKPVYVSTSDINLTDLENGLLHGVDGASTTDNIAKLFPGRFLIETVPQGKVVKYAENSDLPFKNGMEELRRVSSNKLDADGSHATAKLMGGLHYSIPQEMERLGWPTIPGGEIDSARDLAERIHAHWVAASDKQLNEAIVLGDKAAANEVRAARKALKESWTPKELERRLKEDAHMEMSGYDGEREAMLLHQGGLQVPRDKTTFLDQATGQKYSVDEFLAAARGGAFKDAAHIPYGTGPTNPEGMFAGRVMEGASSHIGQLQQRLVDTVAQLSPTGKITVDELRTAMPGLSRDRLTQILKQAQKDGQIDLVHMRPSHGTKVLDEEKHIGDFLVQLHGDEADVGPLWGQYAPTKPGQVRDGQTPMERVANSAWEVNGKAARTAYAELDRVWRLIQAQERKLKPLVSEAPGLGELAAKMKAHLQDENVWGEAARTHKTLTDNYEALQAAREAVGQTFPSRGGRVSPEVVKQWSKGLTSLKGDEGMKAVANYVDAHGRLAEAAGQSLQGYGGYVQPAKKLVGNFGKSYEQFRDDVMTLNAHDRLLKTDREHGTVPSFIAGAGLHALGLGMASYPIANTVMNPGRATKTIASMGAAKRQVMQHINRQVEGLLNSRPVKDLPNKLPRIVAAMIDGTPAERVEAFREHQREMQPLAGDPTAYANHLVKNLGPIAQAAPGHANAMALQGQKLLGYLSGMQPESAADLSTVTEGDPLRALEIMRKPGKAAEPHPSRIREYGEQVAVATIGAPYVLDLMAKGRLRPSHVQTLRTLYPYMDGEVRQMLMEQIPDAKRMTPTVRRGLTIFLNAAPPDSGKLAQRQQVYAEEQAVLDQGAANINPPQVNTITALALPNDRIEAGQRP